MIIKLELPMIEEIVLDKDDKTGKITGSHVERYPDLSGAQGVRWGQILDQGSTMLVWAEISDAELTKIPQDQRKEVKSG